MAVLVQQTPIAATPMSTHRFRCKLGHPAGKRPSASDCTGQPLGGKRAQEWAGAPGSAEISRGTSCSVGWGSSRPVSCRIWLFRPISGGGGGGGGDQTPKYTGVFGDALLAYPPQIFILPCDGSGWCMFCLAGRPPDFCKGREPRVPAPPATWRPLPKSDMYPKCPVGATCSPNAQQLGTESSSPSSSWALGAALWPPFGTTCTLQVIQRCRLHTPAQLDLLSAILHPTDAPQRTHPCKCTFESQRRERFPIVRRRLGPRKPAER